MGCGCGGTVPAGTRRKLAREAPAAAPVQTGGATKETPYVWNGPPRKNRQQAAAE